MASVSIVCAALLTSTLMLALAAQELMSSERASYNDCQTRFPITLTYPKDYQVEVDGEYPHLVHISTQSVTGLRVSCSGSLIWENVILAPASCVGNEIDKYIVALDRSIEGGELFYNQSLKIVAVSKHPNYSPNSGLFNIALMKLDRNVIVSRTVLPICFWPDKELPKSKLFYSEDNAKRMTVSVFVNPIIGAKCAEEYSYAYYGYYSTSPVSPQCMENEEVQTCSTYIRGQIHAKVVTNGKAVPLMIGMMCKITNVAIYISVTKYREWIVKTLNEFGQPDAASTVFDFETCSKRFIDLREHGYNIPNSGEFVESSDVKMEFNVNTVKLTWPENTGTSVTPCYGAHVEPNAVVTLAQCTSYLGIAPSEVMFYDSSVRKIREIIVHPNYTRTEHPNYNDIAILKLESPAGFVPTVCGWYGTVHPSRNVAVKAEITATLPSAIDYSSDRTTEALLVSSFSKHQCNSTQYDQLQISNDSRDKYFCFLHNHSFEQKTYKIQLGAPIKMAADGSRFVLGLNLNECDCNFSTPMIGIRFDAHEVWLKSVLLPPVTKPIAIKSPNTLTVIDTDLEYSDQCGYADGTKGICGAIGTCSSIQQRLTTNKQIIFCGNQTIVCCPQEGNTSAERLKKEFIECNNHYSHLRNERHERSKLDRSLEDKSPHLVEVGWVYGSHKLLDCIGYLITIRDIVTSASCLKSKSSEPNFVRVFGLWSNSSAAAMYIPIHSISYHPIYNETAELHDIALVTLVSSISPSWTLFPGCIWMNHTHAPRQQLLYNTGNNLLREDQDTAIRNTADRNYRKSNVNIHQMYRSDCETYLQRRITDSVACMMLSPWTCGHYYNPSIMEASVKCVPNKEFGSFSYLYLETNRKSYNIHAPIVWNRIDNDGKRIEYLISIFDFEKEDDIVREIDPSNFIGIAHRIPFYIDWISETLEANSIE